MDADAGKKIGKFNNKYKRYSIFELSSVVFGIEILAVKEIVPLPNITRIPNADPFVVGVFSLRGIITTLIDIRHIFGLKVNSIQNENMVLLLEYGSLKIGILIDKVLDIMNINRSEIKTEYENIPNQISKFVYGLYESNDFGIIHLLDLAKFKIF